MQIKFLGTSAGWPLPRLGCSCDICTSRDPKDRRLRPALLVNDHILIDAGPDIYQELLKIKTLDIRDILITHAHPDHILGIWDLTHLYRKGPKPTLIAPQETINSIKRLFSFPLTSIHFQVVKPSENFELNRIKVTYFPVEHTRKGAYGIKLKGEKIVSYIPDVRKIPKSSQFFCRSSDVLILDGSSLSKHGQTRSHISILDGVQIAKDLKPKKVYFTHLGHLTGKHKDLEEYVGKENKPRFYIAYDGLTLDL